MNNHGAAGQAATLSRRQYDYIAPSLDAMRPVAALFDPLSDVVFAVKDLQGRYAALSAGLSGRCPRGREQALGLTPHELFAAPLAQRYSLQDHTVLAEGRALFDRLDPTPLPDGRPGWCLSVKQPVRSPCGRLIGLVCLSRDLDAELLDQRLATCVDHIQTNYEQPLPQGELCDIARLTAGQLDRRMRRLFGASAAEFVRRTRLDAACHAIVHGDARFADIAAACGFADQSALARQCRQRLGLCPRQLRAQAQRARLNR